MRRPLCLACALFVLVSACASPAAAPTSQSMADATTTTTAAEGQRSLVPFTVADWGIDGVAPAAWDQAEQGHFLPVDAGARDARLVHEFYPGVTVAQLVESSLQPGLGLEKWPEPVGGHPSSRLPWQLYTIDPSLRSCPDTTFYLALAESQAGTCVILLLAPKDQREALRQAVFLPAVSALEVLTQENSEAYYRENLALFDYDATAPLEIEELEDREKAGLTQLEIQYASPRGRKVPVPLPASS